MSAESMKYIRLNFIIVAFLCPRQEMAASYSVTPFRHSVPPTRLWVGSNNCRQSYAPWT